MYVCMYLCMNICMCKSHKTILMYSVCKKLHHLSDRIAQLLRGSYFISRKSHLSYSELGQCTDDRTVRDHFREPINVSKPEASLARPLSRNKSSAYFCTLRNLTTKLCSRTGKARTKIARSLTY
jgi:hypothetical protein